MKAGTGGFFLNLCLFGKTPSDSWLLAFLPFLIKKKEQGHSLADDATPEVKAFACASG
jgi:hypothetical protein